MHFCHVTIQTARFDDELAFYTTYAGLVIQRDMRGMGRPMVFLANAAGGTEVELIGRPDAADAGNEFLSIGFVAPDLDALHERLTADGLAPTDFVQPAPQVRFFFVKDPAGVNVQFMQGE